MPRLAKYRRSAACGLMVALAALTHGCRKTEPTGPLFCHVGGTMRPVMQQLAAMYEKQTGQKIEINAAGSGELLANIESHQEGDLYVSHDPFMDVLMERDLGQDAWTVAAVTPTIVVAKNNPLGIKGLADATAPNVSLVLTDFDKSTLGRMLPTILGKAKIDVAELKNRPTNFKTFRKGGQAANAVQTGNGDAAIVWNAVAHLQSEHLTAVPIEAKYLPVEGVDAITSATGKVRQIHCIRVTIATLKCSDQPEAARKFAEFLTSDAAAKVFEESGFTVVPTRKEYADGKKID